MPDTPEPAQPDSPDATTVEIRRLELEHRTKRHATTLDTIGKISLALIIGAVTAVCLITNPSFWTGH